jgi:hypothetical protein
VAARLPTTGAPPPPSNSPTPSTITKTLSFRLVVYKDICLLPSLLAVGSAYYCRKKHCRQLHFRPKSRFLSQCTDSCYLLLSQTAFLAHYGILHRCSYTRHRYAIIVRDPAPVHPYGHIRLVASTARKNAVYKIAVISLHPLQIHLWLLHLRHRRPLVPPQRSHPDTRVA